MSATILKFRTLQEQHPVSKFRNALICISILREYKNILDVDIAIKSWVYGGLITADDAAAIYEFYGVGAPQ
jgi:hypothetical protein